MLKPLASKVVVRRDDPVSITKGGIVIPDSSKRPHYRGRVYQVGPGKMLPSGEIVPVVVKVGDNVVFTMHAGIDVKVFEEKGKIRYQVILDESEILCTDDGVETPEAQTHELQQQVV